MSKKVIAVVGGTGAQGGGVVEQLLERGRFTVRVLTRNPDGDRAKALAARGCEVARADLNAPDTLGPAFAGAYGAFVVTNFWDPKTGTSELVQGKAAAAAAKRAGVQHYVWSMLPNSKAISNGALAVEHFTGKALVDPSSSRACSSSPRSWVKASICRSHPAWSVGPTSSIRSTSRGTT